VAVADVNGTANPTLGRGHLRRLQSAGSQGERAAGQRDGSFQSQRPFCVGLRPSIGGVADVNGDGRPTCSRPTAMTTPSASSWVAAMVLSHRSRRRVGSVSATRRIWRTSIRRYAGQRHPRSLRSHPLSQACRAPQPVRSPRDSQRQDAPRQGPPARDLTVLHTRMGWAIATVDSLPDPTSPPPTHFLYTVSLYAVRSPMASHPDHCLLHQLAADAHRRR